MPPTLQCKKMNNRAGSEDGFTMLEMVCVLAIIGLLAAVLLPSIPRQTSRSRLEAYAIEAATVLKADRNAAIRGRLEVVTLVDAGSRSVRSGASGETVRFPEDVKFEALLPENCNHRPVFASISFFASGMSCGGVIALTHLDVGYEIRVNWLTGRIEVVPRGRLANT
jgi:general secretion pathway protein H